MACDETSRLNQVRSWVAETAVNLRLTVAVPSLCEAAVIRLGVGGAALIMDTSSGWPETRCATSALAARLAELETTVGEGPCVQARGNDGPVLVADLDAPSGQRRWPLFAPLAVEAGARALFTLPLCLGAIRIGILSLYRAEPGLLEPVTQRNSLAFAELARTFLLDEQAGLSTADGDQEAGPPLYSPQVHQATGMISAQLDVGMTDAFARLRARAFAERRPLAELADDVVARRLRFDHSGDGAP